MSFNVYIKQLKELNKKADNNLLNNLVNEPIHSDLTRLQSAIRKFGIHKFDLQYIKKTVENQPHLLTEVNKNGETPIFEAIKLENFDLIYYLLTKNPEYTVNLNKHGDPLVFSLVKHNSIVSLKIALGVNPNIVHHENSMHETALFEAIRQQNYQAVILLADKGSNLLFRRSDMLTPIHAIILEDDETLLRLIVIKYNNLNLVNLSDNINENLIDFAFMNNKSDCFEYMMKNENKHRFK